MKITKYLSIAIVGLVAANLAFAQKASSVQKLRIAEYAINEYYVDSVKEDKLVEDAIVGMLDKLDPHSSYSTPEETKELNEPLNGNFSGIGIQFNMKEDTLYVIQTIAGGPSEKLGIVAGDRIITVNGTTIAGVKMKTSDIMKRLRGPKGSKVDVAILRKGTKGPIDFRITRDNIPLYSIDASYMIDPTIGYVRISRFAAETGKEFDTAVKNLRLKGMKELILDLSDNGGGYLNAAVDVAKEFLNRGDLIVYTEGRNSPRYNATAPSTGLLQKEKVVILVNQYSASASEILAGALQDHDRAVIVGRRSFGKGLVQRPFPFPDGSMIRLTVARYYTPSGRSIQKPYSKGNKEDYDKDILDRYNNGELMHSDSAHVADSHKYTTLTHKRLVYGGGGITPDIFVPLDTTEYSNYYRDLIAKGVFNQNVIDYIDKSRNYLKKEYSNVEDFNNRFEVNEEMMKNLIADGTKEKIIFNEDQFKRSERLIKDIYKALVARDIFDSAAYYQISNTRNELVNEAIKVLKDNTRYNNILRGIK